MTRLKRVWNPITISCDCLRVIVGAALGLLVQGVAYAGVENRPINTDDAYTLDKGAFTVAIGGVFTDAQNGDDEYDLTLDLGYGITDALEVTIDMPYVWLAPRNGTNADGIGDLTIRPELLILQETDRVPAISVASTLKTHTGNRERGLGGGENEASLSFQFSKALGQCTGHFNIGHTWVGEAPTDTSDDVVFYNVAVDHGVNERLVLTAELIGDTNSDDTSDRLPFEGLIGALYDVTEQMTVDVGLGMGFSNVSPDVRVTTGVTYEF